MMTTEEPILDAFHFNKKLKMEQTIREAIEANEVLSPINCVFDETETFVLYACMMGIKIMNVTLCQFLPCRSRQASSAV